MIKYIVTYTTNKGEKIEWVTTNTTAIENRMLSNESYGFNELNIKIIK